MRGGRFDKLYLKLLLMVSTLALTLLGLEVVLRLRAPPEEIDRNTRTRWDGDGNSSLHIRSSDPELVYELRPDAEMTLRKQGPTIRTNADGFRDRAFVKPKPPGTYRILAVGDSVTFGWTQTIEETFPKVLERLFAERAAGDGGRRVEVYNLGVGGYNAEQEAELVAARALALEPDLLIVAYVHNDNETGADNGLWQHFMRSRSRAYDFFHFRLLSLAQRKVGMAPTRRAFAKIARVAGEKRVPVLVTIFPYLVYEDEEGPAAGPPPASRVYRHTALHREVAAIAAEDGFAVLDLEQPFLAVGLDKLRTSRADIIHPNAAGQALAARQMFELVKDKVGP